MRSTVPASLAVLLALTAVSQQRPSLGEAARAAREGKKSKTRVLTNDDLAPETSRQEPPGVPGLLRCGSELKCFLEAIDRAVPAAVIQHQQGFEDIVDFKASTAWWVTRYDGEKLTVQVRLDELEVEVNSERARSKPPGEALAMQARLADVKRHLIGVLGAVNTCQISKSGFKRALAAKVFTPSHVAFHANQGTVCSGPLFKPFVPTQE
jgi:hypothetical protein